MLTDREKQVMVNMEASIDRAPKTPCPEMEFDRLFLKICRIGAAMILAAAVVYSVRRIVGF